MKFSKKTLGTFLLSLARAGAGPPASAGAQSPRHSDPSGGQCLESEINRLHQGFQCEKR
jgi:hypothetical protein